MTAEAPKGETADYSWKQARNVVLCCFKRYMSSASLKMRWRPSNPFESIQKRVYEVTFKKDGLQKGDKKYVKAFNKDFLLENLPLRWPSDKSD